MTDCIHCGKRIEMRGATREWYDAEDARFCEDVDGFMRRHYPRRTPMAQFA